MSASTRRAAVVFLVSVPVAGFAFETDLFVFEDGSAMLPVTPGADFVDSLDVDIADFDNDGDLDALVVQGSADLSGSSNLLWRNDGTGVFTDASSLLVPNPALNSAEVDFGDVDGDGDLDVLIANVGANQLYLWNGFEFVEVGLPQAVPPGPPGFAIPFPPFFIEVTAEARFIDLDGDGDLDITIANENPLPFGPPGDLNRVLINDGTGTFTDDPLRMPFRIDQASGFVPGDIDGDGDTDLVQVNVGQNNVLINDGAGFFTDETATRLPVDADSARKGALADVDGDGDLDLWVANSRGQQNRLYLNDGTGVFTDVTDTHVPVRLDTSTDVKLVDLDGDGDLDAYFANVGDFVFGHGFLGDTDTILLNIGGGVYVDATFPRFEERASRSTNAEFADLDGDGTLDVIQANSGGVNLPGLPPPDGAERLFIGVDCAFDGDFCVQQMLDGLGDDIAALDPTPGADMASTNQTVNTVRKGILAFRADRAQHWFDHGADLLAALNLAAVAKRTDGTGPLPDWVVGDAAARINARAEFAIGVLALP